MDFRIIFVQYSGLILAAGWLEKYSFFGPSSNDFWRRLRRKRAKVSISRTQNWKNDQETLDRSLFFPKIHSWNINFSIFAFSLPKKLERRDRKLNVCVCTKSLLRHTLSSKKSSLAHRIFSSSYGLFGPRKTEENGSGTVFLPKMVKRTSFLFRQ